MQRTGLKRSQRRLEAQAIKCVLDVMRRHPSDSKLQESACCALCDKAGQNAGNQIKITAAGGIECITMAMCSHPTDRNLQRSACGALGKIASHADNVAKIQG